MEHFLAINVGKTEVLMKKTEELQKMCISLKSALTDITTHYNKNFQKIEMAEGMMRRDLIYHEMEIKKINDRCKVVWRQLGREERLCWSM